MQRLRPRRDLAAMREEVKKTMAGEELTPRTWRESLTLLVPACPSGGEMDVKHGTTPGKSVGSAFLSEAPKGRQEPCAEEPELPEKISLIEALVGESFEKIVDGLDGFSLARSSTCQLLFGSPLRWQSKCHKEWGSEGWFESEQGARSICPTVRALGNKVVKKAECTGIAVGILECYPIPSRKSLVELAADGQLPGANVTNSTLSFRSLTVFGCKAQNVSPFDGLAFEETLGSRPGGIGSSGIDWRNTYKTLSGMLAMCHIYSARAAIAAPGSRKKKWNAVLQGMAITANWISIFSRWTDGSEGNATASRPEHVAKSEPSGATQRAPGVGSDPKETIICKNWREVPGFSDPRDPNFIIFSPTISSEIEHVKISDGTRKNVKKCLWLECFVGKIDGPDLNVGGIINDGLKYMKSAGAEYVEEPASECRPEIPLGAKNKVKGNETPVSVLAGNMRLQDWADIYGRSLAGAEDDPGSQAERRTKRVDLCIKFAVEDASQETLEFTSLDLRIRSEE
eukprot:747940-Hanusia_phi.AAC.2